jgi:hypothetical protein
MTANIDVAVVRIATEPMATSSQLLVELVEHDITEEGRERTTLRSPLIHRSDQTVLQRPGVQERRMSLSTRLSVTRAATRDIKISWLTRSKNLSRSRSTTTL